MLMLFTWPKFDLTKTEYFNSFGTNLKYVILEVRNSIDKVIIWSISVYVISAKAPVNVCYIVKDVLYDYLIMV